MLKLFFRLKLPVPVIKPLLPPWVVVGDWHFNDDGFAVVEAAATPVAVVVGPAASIDDDGGGAGGANS